MLDFEIVDLLFRGGATALYFLLLIKLGNSASPQPVRISAVLLLGCVIAYTLNSSQSIRSAIGSLSFLTATATAAADGFFWLFTLTAFADKKLSGLRLVPAVLLLSLGAFGESGIHSWTQSLWLVHNLLSIGLATHALSIVWTSWSADLIEKRREMRSAYMLLVGLYILFVSALGVARAVGFDAPWYPLANAVAAVVMSFGGAVVFLDVRPPAHLQRRPAASGTSPSHDFAADGLILERIVDAMDREELWRREALSIAQFAAHLEISEHKIRRVIHERTGHRNFPAFINSWRVKGAKAALTDPARAGETIASVAFEHGFGSLASFNRIFKEEAGVTPTELRRRASNDLRSATGANAT